MNYCVSNECSRIKRHSTPYVSFSRWAIALLVITLLSTPLIGQAHRVSNVAGGAVNSDFVDLSDIELRYTDPETGFAPILTELDHKTQKSTFEILRENYQKVYLPPDEIFHPLVADPKEHQFYASINHFDTDLKIGNFTAASVGFGERFGLVRWSKLEDAWQLSIAGGLFAQFNMDSGSTDLINADYLIGLNLSRAIKKREYRIRLYHQSTHLGDEFILRNKPKRINFTYEKVDAMTCVRTGRARVCGGLGFLLNVRPSDFDRLSAQFDAEYRSFKGPTFFGPFGRYLAAIDVKMNQQQDWNPNISIKAGIEFGEANRGRRRIRLMLEGYHGYVPFGQFFDRKMSSIGIGGYLGF